MINLRLYEGTIYIITRQLCKQYDLECKYIHPFTRLENNHLGIDILDSSISIENIGFEHIVYKQINNNPFYNEITDMIDGLMRVVKIKKIKQNIG